MSVCEIRQMSALLLGFHVKMQYFLQELHCFHILDLLTTMEYEMF